MGYTGVNQTDPTPSQRAFIESRSPTKIIFGSRQVGKTTALAMDVVEYADDPHTTGPIGVSAPTMRQGRQLLDRCREIAFERFGDDGLETSDLAEFVLPNGTSVQYVPISDLHICEKHMHPSRADEYEYLALDEVDFIPPKAINSIVGEWDRGNIRGLAFAGTACTNSPTIKPLVKDDSWFSVYNTIASSPWTNREDVENAMDQVGPEQAATEYKGLFVSDPAEDADVVDGEQSRSD